MLGEGARWDDRRAELLYVDILAGLVFRTRPDDDGALLPVGSYQLPGTVGAVAPVEGDAGWLLAADRGFVHLGADGSHTVIAEVAPAGTRMNDGACDPQGRFWAGTLADDHREGGAALYRLDGTGRCETVLDGLTISNGLGWSPDAGTMYLVDSGPGVVHAFDFDPERGTIADARELIALTDGEGSPDGLTVDAAGDVWVAIYGAGQVRRYRPDGSLADVFAVPAEQTTCCAFGGRDLRRMYVTTATEGWTDERRRATRDAGLVYRLDVDATGRPAARFRPEPAWWATVTARPRVAPTSRRGRAEAST